MQESCEPGAAVTSDLDTSFLQRADAVIALANAQLAEATPAQASASTLYAAARFNAWNSARRCGSGPAMAAVKQETLDYFLEQYRVMLEEHLDWYIANFPERPGER